MTHPFALSSLRLFAAGLLVAGAGATFSTAALAEAPPPPPRGTHHPMPPMFGGFPGGLLMPGRGLDRMLDGVKATPEQRDQIHKIADAAAADMKAQHEAGRGLHEQSARLFTAPTVDAAAAESLRQQMMAEREKGSRRMLQAMIDVANVLTPEQRQQIAERMEKRRSQMEKRHHRAPGAPGEPAPNR